MATLKKRKKIIIFSIIGLALLGLTLAAVFRKKDPIVTVQTDKVTRRSLTELVVANGKIQPVRQVVISPEVAGEIIQLGADAPALQRQSREACRRLAGRGRPGSALRPGEQQPTTREIQRRHVRPGALQPVVRET